MTPRGGLDTAPKTAQSPTRASLERDARLSRLTGASLIGLAITVFWTLRLLGVL